MTEKPWEWPFRGNIYRKRSWKLRGKVYQLVILGLSRVWMSWPLNSRVIYNHERLTGLIDKRIAERKRCGQAKRPLLTLSNHISCMDDPLMWGALMKIRYLLYDQLRWVPTASEICFTNRLSSHFFGHGQCVPVVRAAGVYQRGVDFCVARLNEGEWVHFFPEGKVNIEGEKRLKWGIGRVIADCTTVPDVLPIWIVGMDNVLPNKKPYIPRVGQNVMLYVGQPIRVEAEVERIKEISGDPMVIRKHITDYIQEQFWKLKDEAITHHERTRLS